MSHRRSSTRRTQERKFFRSHFSRREGYFPGGNFFAENPKKLLTIRQSAGIITPVVRHGTNIWGISSAGRALAWHARGHRFDPGILHHTVRTRTRFFTRKGSGTFFVYRKFCGRTTQSVKRAKAGYHYDGGILPFALRNQVRFVRTWSSPYMTHWGQSLCTCVPGERVHLWQGVTH